MTMTLRTDAALHEELARKDGELRLVAEVSDLIGCAAPIGAILDRIAARVAGLLDTPYAAILLITVDGRQMTIAGAYGLADAYIAVINRHGLDRDGIAGLPSFEVYRSGRPRIWDDMPGDPHLAHFHEAQRLQGVSAMVVVPLWGPDGPIGTLNCYHPQPCHFGERDVELLTRVAAHAARAIHNANLVERLNASVRRLSEMNAVVQRQNETLARSDAIHRRLTALVLDEHGLEAIVRALSGLVGCPVCLYDAAGSLLTSAAPAGAAPLPAFGLHGRRGAWGGPGQAVVRVPAGTVAAVDLLVCPVRARGKTLAFLVAPDSAATAGELERRALEHAATVCAVELLRQRVGQEVAWRQRAAFLDDLLAGRLRGAGAIVLRARQLGFTLEGPARMLLVGLKAGAAPADDDQVGERGQQLVELVGRIAQQQPQALVVARGAQVAVLLPDAPDAPTPAHALAALIVAAGRARQPAVELAVGLSGLALDGDGLARAYGEAAEALAVLTHLAGEASMLAHDEVGVLGLLVRGATRDELLRLAHQRLDALLSYGERRGVDLVTTLERYLRCGCHAQRTAELLFVHPNTVKHRLRLAGEQTGLDLDDMRQLLELQLALLVRRLHPAAFAP